MKDFSSEEICEIIEMYGKDFTMRKIALKFNTNKQRISNIIKNNGIKIKRHKRKYSFYYEQSLSQRQKEILVGSLLGDGCVHKHHEGINSCRYIETHSIKQKDYAMWKYNEFKNFISNNFRFCRNGFINSEKIVFETVLHKDFCYFYDLFYQNNKKIIPQNIKSFLTPLSLAIWYMDDGSQHIVYKRPVARFSTYCFLENDIDILIEAMKNNFNIICRKVKSQKGIIVQICQSETEKLFKIIKPYILESMSYKIKSIYNPAETWDSKSQSSLFEIASS